MRISRQDFFKACGLGLMTAAFAGKAFATPPSDILLEFNNETKELKVNCLHQTLNEKIHFIKTINIFLDGEDYLTRGYSDQTNKEAQIDTIKIKDAKPGSKIGVEGICNIRGSKKVKMTVK
jgi:hypothetical protein